MKHIKYFEEKALYESYINGNDLILPNVSYVEDVNEVFYNPSNNNSTKNYMYVEALEDGLSVQFNQLLSADANSLEYSTDQKVWKITTNGVSTDTISTGEKLYFRGDVTNMDTTFDFGNNMYGIGTFMFDKKCNIGGNIMSLLFNDNFEDKHDLSGYDGIFAALFADANQTGMLVNADKLILPAKILSTYCYIDMFVACTSLTSVPELPATILADHCYREMFQVCTSLTSVPELPATTLAEGCYGNMFYGCTSLTTAPSILPATTLAERCYVDMFNGCTSLITAPQLPATTLAEHCYTSMFGNCTSLVTAPELPATTLTKWCYGWMFSGCTSLNNITMLATDINATSCLYSWTYNVASTGTFTKHPSMTSLQTGYYGIPSGWEVVDYEIAS